MQLPTEQDAVNKDEVRAALARILASPEFCRSPQLQRLLSFIVNESLSGGTDHLKEYTIGVEVFARPASYDPRLDALVRVEVKRLRDLLEHYYARDGAADPLRIKLPKGSYLPQYQPSAAQMSTEHAPALFSNSVLSKRSWSWGAMGVVIATVVLFGYMKLHIAAKNASFPRTIAVLPFENLSRDPEDDFLCFALMEEVTTDLAKYENLRVIARTSAARFKRADDISRIARQLNADAIIEGSVSRSGDRVRVSAQLINAKDSIHIWAENYERSGADPLVLQSEISSEIARSVASRLIPEDRTEHQSPQYSNIPEANQLYWKGVYFRVPIGTANWRESLEKSASFFQKATLADPEFAAAYSALADVCTTLAYESGGSPITLERMSCARQSAMRALQLDRTNSEAYGALGTVQFYYDYDYFSAEKSFQQALRVNPSNARVHMWYAMVLAPQARFDEAIAQAREAQQLDPLSFAVSNHLAVINYVARRYDDAASLAHGTLALDSKVAPAHAILGMVFEAQGKFDEAVNEYQAALRLSPNHPFVTGRLGHAYALANQRDEARKIIADTQVARNEGSFSHVYTAYVYVGLGDADHVFEQLEIAYEHHDPDLPFVAVDSIFDSVRSDERYSVLMKRMHLGN